MKKLFILLFLQYVSVLAFAQHNSNEVVVGNTPNDSIRQIELSEIVVSVTRANHRTPTTFTNLRAMEVNRVMVAPEIPTAIGLTPSVVTASENGAAIGNQTFRIRGSDATRINVTFDGVPLNDGESQSVFWANMPDLMSSLQTMQIQRGVGTSVNGAAAFGATLNMQSAQPAIEQYGEVSTAYGSFNTFKLNVAAGTGRRIDGWNADMRYSLGKTDGYIENSGSDQYSLFFTGGYSSSQRVIKMNYFHGDQKTGISWEGVPESEIDLNRRYNPSGLYTNSEGNRVRYNNETDNYQQTHVHLHYTEQLSEFLKLNTTLYYTRGKGYYEQYKFNERLNRYGLPNYTGTPARSDLIRRQWLDNDLWGAILTATYTTVKTDAILGVSGSIYDNRHYGNIIWAPENIVSVVIPKGYEWYHNTGNKSDVSAFLKVTQQFAERWYAFGDIQWRNVGYKLEGIDNDITDLTQPRKFYNFFNPKAGITFAITSQQRAYASFAVGHREPKRADIKDALKRGGTTMPRPETLYNVEAGYEFYDDVWTLGANYFYMYYIDQLVNTGKKSDTGYDLMENVPVSYRTGVELTVGVRPVRTLRINGNIAYSRNKIKDYVAYVNAPTSDNPNFQIEEHLGTTDIAFSPEWVGAVDVTYEIAKGLSVGSTAKYVGKQYYDNTSNAGRQLNGYFVNNALAQYRFDFKKYYAALQFAVNNLWNADYITNATVYRGYSGSDYWETKSFFPQPFRNYMLKLTVGGY